MEIVIPPLKTPNTLRFIKTLHELDITGEDEIALGFESNWVCPFGMILCCSALRQLRAANASTYMTMTVPHNQVSDYAGHMGFFKSVSESIDIGNAPGEASGNNNYVPITVIDFTELHRKAIEQGNYGDMNDTIETEAKRLSKVLCRSNSDMQRLFSYIIREILRNIPEHSDSNKAIICAQYWSDGRAEIAILDEGIGIKNSLMKNTVHREYVKTDIDALESAIKPGISQAFSPDKKNNTHDEWSNSGFGLYMASEICKKLTGVFWMASGEKAIQVNCNGITEHNTFFNGTAIGIQFNVSHLKGSQQLITEIAKAGEKEAKSIRNAFKNASEPSKSLLMNADKENI